MAVQALTARPVRRSVGGRPDELKAVFLGLPRFRILKTDARRLAGVSRAAGNPLAVARDGIEAFTGWIVRVVMMVG